MNELQANPARETPSQNAAPSLPKAPGELYAPRHGGACSQAQHLRDSGRKVKSLWLACVRKPGLKAPKTMTAKPFICLPTSVRAF